MISANFNGITSTGAPNAGGVGRNRQIFHQYLTIFEKLCKTKT